MKTNTIGTSVHAAFQLRPGTDPLKQRLEALDIFGNHICYGDSKGFVFLCQIQVFETSLRCQTLANVNLSKKPIDNLVFMRNSNNIAVLNHGVLSILDGNTLAMKKTLGKNVTAFSVNPTNDWIAMAIGKKIQLFAYKPETNDFANVVFGKSAEISAPDSVSMLVWNGDTLGAALKKNYVLIVPQSGTITEFMTMNSTTYPYVGLYKDNWLAISGDNIGIFEKTGKLIPNTAINLQASHKSNPIRSIAVQNYYLLVLRDTIVQVFNLIDCTKVQEIELERADTGRVLVPDVDKVLIAVDAIPAPKKDPLGKVVYLRAIPPEEQIKRLLFQSKVSEAQKVFTQNNSPMDPDFENKREEFNVEAGWTLFQGLEFDKAIGFFSSVNYDPREFLALVPNLLGKGVSYRTINDLVDQRMGQDERKDAVIKEGIRAIIRLVEEKRKYLVEKYDLVRDVKKPLEFTYSSTPLNESFRLSKPTLEELMELIDNSLLKLYFEEKDLKLIQGFFEATKELKCSYKTMEGYFKEKMEKDSTFTAHVCLAFLYDRYGNFTEALEMWKMLGSQGLKETRDLACKETERLLMTQVTDKKMIFEYAKMILLLNPEEGLKIFTENPALPKFVTEDDIISYLEGLENFQTQLKEKYLEHLVSKNGTDERFHTLLGLHYIAIITATLKKENKKTVEVTTDPIVGKYRDKLNVLLKTSKNYNVPSILGTMKGMGMFEEEILLYSKQKMHGEALASLVELGKSSIDFTKAEQYCLEQSENLLDTLFGKLMEMYKDAKARYNLMEKDKAVFSSVAKVKSELDSLKGYVIKFEEYCKAYLKKYASNEKMNAEAIINMLPEDWGLIEQREGHEDSSLLQYLELTFNDRLEKANNYKVAKGVAEMHKLNLEADLLKLQRAYVVISPERKCKVCIRQLAGAKSFYVFPNGVVTHLNCVKDVNICPVTNINFLKKIYK
eukprot:TRINITY_DN120428_c0_g1_i1.p1 TRINITY_DN120428_c0_g1~~TRINITY_DN120428_c0_g1_i1.p1  ORF type:complete len:983 (+),score=128.19 TRINITY_DN120428_c0_g1_i1:95-2950(+)